MRQTILLKANFKRHKGTMAGIFIIMLAVALSSMSVMTIWLNSTSHLEAEMERMNYGDLTAWTSSLEDEERLYSEIEQLHDVEAVHTQQLIYADYEIFDQHSDSEGQLVVYEPEVFPYRFFREDLTGYYDEEVEIAPSELYLSPTVLAAFDSEVGDRITFPIGRQGKIKTFHIKGTFEDPFMGSSMIGMKSFLISQEDYDEIQAMIEEAGIDALARTGQMIHITQSSQSTLNNAQFNQLINEETSIGESVEFMHSRDAISGFMLILQDAFAGLSMAFALVLMIVSMIIVGYSLSTTMDQDERNMGILKTAGYDGAMLRSLLKRQYLIVIAAGFVTGIIVSFAAVPLISERMVSFAGMRTPTSPQLLLGVLALAVTMLIFYLFIHMRTKRIESIPPVQILQQAGTEENVRAISIRKHFLMIHLSLRQLLNGRKRYRSVWMTAVLLVFITSTIVRMNSWLGVDGKGMMDAFNPADLDVGVQLLGNQSEQEMEDIIQKYSPVTDSYELAMPGVSLNGVDVTGNVISEPERFHIRQGSTSQKDDEIVITDTIAADLDLAVGERVTLSYNGKSAAYHISGIYQCANDMGANIGMSREGFLRIGAETKEMWCHHYFLEDPEQKQAVIDDLNARYGGDVYIHENTWPGLFSIIAAMRMLLIVMYGGTALFILIVTVMTGHKIFLFEKRNLSIYKALGFTTAQLRSTFAIRYGIVAVMGSIVGILISALLTDTLAGTLMKLYGISNFASSPSLMMVLLPGIIVSMLFACFAYLTSRSITKLEMSELVSE